MTTLEDDLRRTTDWIAIAGAARAHFQQQIDQVGRLEPSPRVAEMMDDLTRRLELVDRWKPEKGEVPRPPPPPWARPVKRAWIGVDLDRTLAEYDRWRGIEHVGKPIGPMVERVRGVIAQGYEVRILTARVGPTHPPEDVEQAKSHIQIWCKHTFGFELEVTCVKDGDMVELWDDRAVGVEENTGVLLSPSRVLGKPDAQLKLELQPSTTASAEPPEQLKLPGNAPERPSRKRAPRSTSKKTVARR